MKKAKKIGSCYHTSEALFHLLGGRHSGWQPAYIYYQGGTHWFLVKDLASKTEFPIYLDPTKSQFTHPPHLGDYQRAIRCGFLTSKPSKRARELMEIMLWQ